MPVPSPLLLQSPPNWRAAPVPTIYDRRANAEAGGLMSNGTHYLDRYRLLGIYTTKILNGAKPADLPVEQSTKV